MQVSKFHESRKSNFQVCIKLNIPLPPVGGGEKIKGFGDGEENQRVEKKKILNLRRFYSFGSSKR